VSASRQFDYRAIRRVLKDFAAHEQESECCDSLSFVPTSATSGVLTVVFMKRGTYTYEDFPVEEWLLFNNAASRGTYFNLYVRDRYSHERVA